MNNPDGIPINAVYGFTNMMVKLIEDFNPQDICVLFDFGRETLEMKSMLIIKLIEPHHLKI